MREQTNKQTICIAGKNSIATEGLSYLLTNFPEFEYKYIPNKSDGGLDSWQPSLKKFAESKGVQEISLETAYEIPGIKFISLEFDRLVKPSRFSSSELFNIHFSLLPAYKGMYTSAHPILNGEKYSGVTLHKIFAGIDTGDIIAQTKFPISGLESARELYFRYLDEGLNLFVKHAESILSSNYVTIPQGLLGSTYFGKDSIDYKNLSVNLNVTAIQLINQIRAYSFREFQLPKIYGKSVIKAESCEAISCFPPGKVLWQTKFSMAVSTIDFDVVLTFDPVEGFIKELREGTSEQAILWIDKIRNLDDRDENGWTPLIVSSYKGDLKTSFELLTRGANPNTPNFKGTTPLMYAFTHFEQTGNKEMCKLLLNYGANIHAADNSGRNLEFFAKKRDSLLKYEELMVHINQTS
ncbi:formyltransferase family protein [Aurantimicrobium minutum]|uniref:formyltransferase family protein n=1 Tax=Aurantimicrobium minutum TaxID=708131 RepID=UPI0024733874|nr:formyltransferase family protein [Aurantimicrobium minutum]MDH6239031.1 methionyl-tRNA formyltransferase [Aurantimicrobium minutum]